MKKPTKKTNVPGFELTNAFLNASQLKQRIIMLNRPKTNQKALWRYVIVAPLIAVPLLYMAGCDEQAKPLTNETKSAKTTEQTIVEGRVLAPDGKPLPGASIVLLNGELGTSTDVNGNYKITLPKGAKSNVLVASFQGMNTQQQTVNGSERVDFTLKNGIEDRKEKQFPAPPPPIEAGKTMQDSNGVYLIADEHPVFPGGMSELGRYIAANLRYPEAAKRANVSGRVFVRFIIDEDGTVRGAKILKGIGFGADEEALRIMASMPRWQPAKVGGKPVAMQYNLPINFALN